MKFFHLSDLHIGLKLMNYDFSEDQEYVLTQVIDRAAEEKPDAVIIAGDVYDKAVPSAEAVEMFDRFISRLSAVLPDTVIMVISGNHDSAPRLNCFRNVLQKNHIHMVGLPPQKENESIQKVVLNDVYGSVNFYLLPFVKPSMIRNIVGTDENGNLLSYEKSLKKLIEREKIDTSQRNVIVSHQFYLPEGKNAGDIDRADSEIRTVGNIDEISSTVIQAFDYAALGHIHKPMKVGSDTIRYCGTPLACSVSEAGQEKGIIVVDMKEKNTPPNIRVIPLTPLRNIRIMKGTAKEVLQKSCDDYVTVILTDEETVRTGDFQEKLKAAFPYLLEIRRENIRKADYTDTAAADKTADPYELCCSFLKELDEKEKEILQDVINSVWEEDVQ